MKKQKKKHVHHFKLHLGMYISIAAILVTAVHTSESMVQAMYGMTPHMAEIGSEHMREIKEFETHIGHAQISMGRRNYVGGI